MNCLQRISQIDRDNGYNDRIAVDAIWHFFKSDTEDNAFLESYEKRYVNQRKTAEKIYIYCSSFLFDRDTEIAHYIEENNSKKLWAIIKDMTEEITTIINKEN